MCGIAGIFTADIHCRHTELSRLMVQELRHRGPDFYTAKALDEFCSLAHSRLKIIDLSDTANQPMFCYQKRLVIVFNGEIYNYKQLKLGLQRVAYKSADKIYPFQTQSDTEVVLAAYYRWGKECVKYLDGMFAFAIYDTQNKELFLARDRQGKKPLYYIHTNDTFAFASEIRALLQSSLSCRKLDISQLYDYFQYQTNFEPHTLIEDIQLLEAANTLKLSFNHQKKIVLKKNRYWKAIEKTLNKNDLSYEDAQKQVRHLLFSAVEKRLVSDVPLGAFLSGGIDSSAIVAVMKQFFSSQLDTFHVTTNNVEFSEKKYADTLSEIYKTNHHTIVLKEEEILNLVNEAIHNIDYPTGDGINTYIVSKTTKNAGITVALSGLGGDELFAGYPQFKIISRLHKLDVMDFSWLRKLFATFIPENLFKFSYRMKILMQAEQLSAHKIFPFYRQIYSGHNIPLNLKERQTNLDLNLSKKNLLNNQHILSYLSLLEMKNYMRHVLLRDTDQMSMAHALEVRAPFLDTELVTFVLSLPDEYKYPSSPKKLLTDAIGDILPGDIINRKKMGFVLPFKIWMRKDLKNSCDEKLKKIAAYSFIDANKLVFDWKAYQNKKHEHWWKFWHLIILQNWIEKNNIQVQ